MLRRLAAAASVLHAAQHRRGRGDEAPEAGEDAGLEVRRVHRRSLDRPDQFYQPGQRANGRVGRREFCIRPLAAEPARLEMDEAGIPLLDRREIERRTIRRIDVAAVEQDVAAADQFRQARRCVRIVRIERDARLVEIEKCEPGAVSFRRQRRGAAKRVALRRLDLLNGRAEIGEQARAIARRGAAPDLDNPQMRQRAHHASSWPMTSAGGAGPFLVAGHETLLGFRCKWNFVPRCGIREKRASAGFVLMRLSCTNAFDDLEARWPNGNPDVLRTSPAATPKAAARRVEDRRARRRWRGKSRAVPARSQEDRRRCSGLR